MDKVPATGITIGDIIEYTTQTRWLILSIDRVDKSVRVTFEYLSCEFEPSRVGTVRSHSFRATTKLRVLRVS